MPPHREGLPQLTPQIPWLRVLVEGVVIVGSILLAFGLQAWWDGFQERPTGPLVDYLEPDFSCASRRSW